MFMRSFNRAEVTVFPNDSNLANLYNQVIFLGIFGQDLHIPQLRI